MGRGRGAATAIDPLHRSAGRAARCAIALAALAMLAAAPPGRETLGQFGAWGAFRDAAPRRCFAIAAPVTPRRKGGGGPATLAFANWPRLRARDQLHARLSRAAAGEAMLEVGDRRFALRVLGADAWSGSARDDARIVAAVRGAGSLTLHATDRDGHRFRDRYALDGAASAIDAARLGCPSG